MKTKYNEEVNTSNYHTLGCEELCNLSYNDAIELGQIVKDREQSLLEKCGAEIREFENLRHYYLIAEEYLLKYDQEPTKVEPIKTNLYLMRDGHTGLTKIGISKNPTEREATLQGQIPLLELLWSCESNKDEETQLHEFFGSNRVRGEWFDLNSADVAYIRSLAWRA